MTKDDARETSLAHRRRPDRGEPTRCGPERHGAAGVDVRMWRIAPDASIRDAPDAAAVDATGVGGRALALFAGVATWHVLLHQGLAGVPGGDVLWLPDGRSVQVRVEPAVDDAGHVVEVTVIAVDVTELVAGSTGAERHVACHSLLADERARLADELNTTVVPQLFGVGLALQGLVARVDDADVSERISRGVTGIDVAIRQLRNALFASARTGPATASGLGEAVTGVVADARRVLPGLRLAPLPAALDADRWVAVTTDLLATLRECLANVARHALATTVDVVIRVDEHSLSLSVQDDGRGCPAMVGPGGLAGHGLANLRARAERFGGRFEVFPVEPTGTLARWSICA